MTEPRRIGAEAGRFVQKSAGREALEAAKVLQAWDRVAGPEVLRQTRGGRFKNGELLVHVHSSAWANELQMMSETFRARLNESLGKTAVRSIWFTVSKSVGERNAREAEEQRRERRYDPRARTSRTLSEEDEREVERVAEKVADEGIREALARAMKATVRLRPPERETPR